MAENNRLSVCLLGYKHAPFVEECITAVWAGGHDNIEIIALDDGSNDGTIEKLRKIAPESPFPLKILEQENQGNIPRNFNTLLKNASGEYVFFSAMDDAPMPGSLGRMMNIARQERHAFVAHTNALTLGSDARIEYELFAPAINAQTPADLLSAEYENLHSFYIQGAIFRRDIVNEVKGFDESLLGDDIVLRTKVFSRLIAEPAPFALIDAPGCVYRRHAGNVSKNCIRQVKVGMQYCDKFWPDRPYPEILRAWVLTALENGLPQDALPLFRFGKKGKELLRDAKIRAQLEQMQQRSAN